MKKSAAIRPVSQKAYVRFVERINLVFTDSGKRESMLAALEKYLNGDKETYSCGLTPDCVLAFEMLRFDIDLAIARSAKARMRAGRRKESAADVDRLTEMLREIAENYSAEHARDCDEKEVGEDAGKPFVAPKTRRQRRAEARCVRQKSRWRKL